MKLVRASAPLDGEPSIEVEFLVLHYTAESLDDTLRIFDASDRAGAHLVIGETGEVHEVTPCLEGRALRAPHAGASRWDDGDHVWESFNDFSLGIEIVNRNGNVFEYTDGQYESLSEVMKRLLPSYPALRDPERVVGHEQIAGWRGKADPGARFDWGRFFRSAYPNQPEPTREPVCGPDLLHALEALRAGDPADEEDRARFWRAVSYLLERTQGGRAAGPMSGGGPPPDFRPKSVE